MAETWRDRCRPIIAEILERCQGMTLAEKTEGTPRRLARRREEESPVQDLAGRDPGSTQIKSRLEREANRVGSGSTITISIGQHDGTQ